MTADKKEGAYRLSFRPFRRVGDKLVVTTYMCWRKIYSSNNHPNGAIVKLLPFPEVKKGEIIYASGNPDGNNGFWHPTRFDTRFEPLFWPIQEEGIYYMLDCDGCPAFSHKTVVYVSENFPDKIELFELLTAEIVYEYFEKMRDDLKNVKWINQTKTHHQ